MLVPAAALSTDAHVRTENPHHSKWKSLETRILKSKKPTSASFSAMFFTATFDCATSQTPRPFFFGPINFNTDAAMTDVFPVPGGP